MLRLVLGRSGSGKTDYIYEQLETLVWGGESRAVLLVPEQYSFESERRLLAMFGPRFAAGVQVLSFTRLAEMVDRELGGTAGRPMDDITRMLLMSRALEEVGDRLTLYRRQIDDQAYIRAMLGLVSECRQYAVTPRRLLETAEALPTGGTLREKTEELALIFEAYEALAANGYVDPQDALTRLAERMPQSALLLDTAVFVDGFKGFTEQETAVLGGVFRKARQTMVALCTDTLEEDGLSLFSAVTRTANRLVRLARENGVPVAAPVHLRENRRTASPALAALERGCFRPQPTVCDGEAPEVEIACCGEVYEESARAARRIRRLLREEGLRCREIAVVARSLADYEGVLDAALEREEIPFYMDRRQDILTDPLITLTQGAIRCAAGGWDGEELLQMLKTGLLGFSPRSVAALENYVYLWNIRGSGWRRDWDWNPEGLSVKADEAAARRLAWLNLLRRRAARPLERLTAAFARDGGRISGRRFGEAVYRYLQEAQVPRLLRLQVRRLDAAGEPALADRMERLWELLMSLLDRFGTVMGETVLPARRFAALFALAAATADLGSIPQGLDAVQVGSADRMRFSAPKAVLILGANEGVFPAWPTTDGLLTADEREALAAAGLTLAAGREQAALEERLFAYLAVAAPSERLVISYVGSSGGEAALPSVLVESVRRILPRCRDGRLEEELPIESEADAFDRLAAHYREPEVETASLRRVFEERPGYRERLAALGQAAAGAPAAFRDAAAAKALFGGDMRLSPSRVEAYHRCRFSYFCRYGLRARVLRPAELDAAEFGTLTHYVMERTLPAYTAEGFANIRRERVAADTAAAVAAYVDEYMGGRENKPSRFLHMLARLERTCSSLLWQVVLEFRQSRFVPVDYELAVGLPPEEGGGAVDPVVLTLPDGARIRVQGKVDRVDAYRAGEETYIRVVDYKTGAREFRLSDVTAGINLQMLIYLFAIWQNGAPRYGTVTPAGVLYLPAKLPVIRVERGADGERQERERLRAMRMNGLLLDNPEIVEAMEADAAGLFIPAKLGAKGFDRSSSIASLEQFGLLRRKIERLLCEMAETLRAGDIAAVPATGETVDACAVCDFRAVCGHEQGDAVRFVAKRDAAEVLRELETVETGFSEN